MQTSLRVTFHAHCAHLVMVGETFPLVVSSSEKSMARPAPINL